MDDGGPGSQGEESADRPSRGWLMVADPENKLQPQQANLKSR